ncbi:MAG: glycine oxidase ThiO [Gemmatimonadaceae bacterium]
MTFVGTARAGGASLAAAGILAPGVERGAGPVEPFAVAARDRYPSYVAELKELTGYAVGLQRSGVIQIAATERESVPLRSELPPGCQWLEPADLRSAEPGLAPCAGGIFHPFDGSVDNVALHHAMTALVKRTPNIRQVTGEVSAISLDGECGSVHTETEVIATEQIVLAAGAWIGRIRGIPRPLPVRPIRGQMVAYPGTPIGHVIYGSGGYAVPRSGTQTLVGATMEEVGFDPATTREGIAMLEGVASRLVASFAGLPASTAWAGLRPVTPDLLPIIGRDPEFPALLYACGHSRNGILLAPLTGDVIGGIVSGDPLLHDIRPFAVTRFPYRPPLRDGDVWRQSGRD